MKRRRQFGGWLCGLALSAALALPCAAAQHPGKDRPPQAAPAPKPERENRRNDRPPNAGGGGNAKRFNENRGQAGAPVPNGQQRWRNMTPQEKQRIFQNQDRLRHLPPAQQQQLRERAQVWQKMTPEQRDHIRNDVLPRWKQMPPDRKQAIQQRLRVLQNMPESARNQRLNDPNFTRGMSEEDRSTLHDLSHLHVGGAPEPPTE
jgi:predicted Fe-S protein YdhL (DUF1289 family)